MVYENCKIYGPYLNKKDNRLRCVLVFPDKTKRTISYPKFLMERYLDRYLDVDETVDHIDGNTLNNDISNLQILKLQEHAKLDVKRNKDVVVKCLMCGKNFTISGSSIRNHNRDNHNNSGYFCSKQCVGKYGSMIQHGKIKPVIIDKIIPDTYTVKSAQKEIFDVEAG